MQQYNKIFSYYRKWLTETTLLSPITVSHYLRITTYFLNYLNSLKIMRLNDVDIEVIRQFAYFNQDKKPYSPAFIKLRLAALNCFFSWTYEKGFSRENPVLQYKKSRIKHKPIAKKEGRIASQTAVILTPSQQDLLYNSPIPNDFIAIRNKCIAVLILSTALFIEEVITLPLDALNFSQRYIILKGDTPRRRKTPMNPQCYKVCKKWLTLRKRVLDNIDSSLLFFTQHFNPLTRRNLYHNVSDYMTSVGLALKHQGPEVLRQTAICNMLKHYRIGDVKEFTGISFEQLEKYKALINK